MRKIKYAAAALVMAGSGNALANNQAVEAEIQTYGQRAAKCMETYNTSPNGDARVNALMRCYDDAKTSHFIDTQIPEIEIIEKEKIIPARIISNHKHILSGDSSENQYRIDGFGNNIGNGSSSVIRMSESTLPDYKMKTAEQYIDSLDEYTKITLCNHKNLDQGSIRSCENDVKKVYGEAGEFAHYFNGLFEEHSQSFGEKIIISPQMLISYVAAHIGEMVEIETRGNENTQDYMAVNPKKANKVFHNGVLDQLEARYPQEQTAIEFTKGLGGEIGEVINNPAGDQMGEAGIIGIPKQQKSYNRVFDSIKRVIDKMNGKTLENANGSKPIVFGGNGAHRTERAKLGVFVEQLDTGKTANQIARDLGLNNNGKVSQNEYKTAQIVLTGINEDDVTFDAPSNGIANEGSDSTNLGFVVDTEIKVKTPKGGTEKIGTFETIVATGSDGVMQMSDDTTIEEVLSNLSGGSQIAFDTTTNELGIPNVGVTDYGGLANIGGGMTEMGTSDNPMTLVQGDTSYSVFMNEQGQWEVIEIKGNVVQKYKMIVKKRKRNNQIYISYTSTVAVDLDLNEAFTVGAKIKNGELSGNASLEYIKKVAQKFSIGAGINLDTQEGLGAFLNLYFPGAKIQFSHNGFISIKFKAFQVGKVSLSPNVVFSKDGKITPAMNIANTKVPTSQEEINKKYDKAFKKLANNKGFLYEISERIKALGMEITDENRDTIITRIINAALVDEKLAKEYDFSPFVNIPLSKDYNKAVFGSWKGFTDNILSLVGISATVTTPSFGATGHLYSTKVKDDIIDRRLKTSLGADVLSLKQDLGSELQIEASNVDIFIEEDNTQTLYRKTGNMTIPDGFIIKNITLKYSKDLKRAGIVYKIIPFSSNSSNSPTTSINNSTVALAEREAIERTANDESYVEYITGNNNPEKKVSYAYDVFVRREPQYVKSLEDTINRGQTIPLTGELLKIAVLNQIFANAERNMGERHAGLRKTIGNNQRMLQKNLEIKAKVAQQKSGKFSIGREAFGSLHTQYVSSIQNDSKLNTYTVSQLSLVEIIGIDGKVQKYIIGPGYTMTGYGMVTDGINVMGGNDECIGNMFTISPLDNIDIFNQDFRTKLGYNEKSVAVGIAQSLQFPSFQRQAVGDPILEETGRKILASGNYDISASASGTLEGGNGEFTGLPRPEGVNNGMTPDQIESATLNQLAGDESILAQQFETNGFYTADDITNMQDGVRETALRTLGDQRTQAIENASINSGYLPGTTITSSPENKSTSNTGEEGNWFLFNDDNTKISFPTPKEATELVGENEEEENEPQIVTK